MAYWAAVQVEANRDRLAAHCLDLAGYEVYAPRIMGTTPKARRITLLFPGYVFVQIVRGWWEARWSAGVVRLISHGAEPTPVSDHVIAEIQSREHNGLIVLPKPRGLQRGDRVRVTAGAFAGCLGLYEGQRPHERISVLLAFLGAQTRVELARRDVSAA
jgi:transcription antitermination factor NusG